MTTDEMVAAAKEGNRNVLALVEMMRQNRAFDAETYWFTLDSREQAALIGSLIRYAYVGLQALAATQGVPYDRMVEEITKVIDGPTQGDSGQSTPSTPSE